MDKNYLVVVFLVFCSHYDLGHAEVSPNAEFNTDPNPNRLCMHKAFYSRDFGQKCCKTYRIMTPMDIYEMADYSFNKDMNITDCKTKTALGFPNDDISASLWRTLSQCILKDKMSLENEAALDFPSFVNFMTESYHTDSDDDKNVQQLVRNANKECPDGDSATEFHKKVQAYYHCFFTNEATVCKEELNDDLKTFKTEMSVMASKHLGGTESSCGANPGIWREPNYCCKSHITPTSWSSYTITLPKIWEVSGPYKTCMKNVRDLSPTKEMRIFHNDAGQSSLHGNATQSITFQASQNLTGSSLGRFVNGSTVNVTFQPHCHLACLVNPVQFKYQNGSGEAPEIKWETDTLLNSMYNHYPEGVRKEMKADFMEMQTKTRFLIMSTHLKNTNSTRLSLDEIVERYSNTDSVIEKIIYYCNYYSDFTIMADAAAVKYCTTPEAADNLMNAYNKG